MRGVSRREDPPAGTARKNIAEKQRPGHAAGALFVGLVLFAGLALFVGVRCLYHLQGLRCLRGLRCLWGLRCLRGGHGLGQRGDQRPDMALSSCTFCRMAASACWGSAASAVASSMGQRPVPVRFRMDSATSSQV